MDRVRSTVSDRIGGDMAPDGKAQAPDGKAQAPDGKAQAPDGTTQRPLDRVPTGAELTALDPIFCADPHPVLARLREREPVHRDDVIKRWVLTRANDCERVLRDRTMA